MTVERIAFTMESMILKSNAHQNPSTLNPSMRLDMTIMIRAFITRVKSHIVTMFIGSVRSKSTGRINVLRSARRIATPSAGINPDNATPGKTYAVITTARAVTSRLIMIHVVSIGTKLKSKTEHYMQNFHLFKSHFCQALIDEEK